MALTLTAEDRRRIAENVSSVRRRIEEALQRAGRPKHCVTLVAVTKYGDEALARALVEAGCRDLGESRPQELARKASALGATSVRWHLIGHLQRNKVPLVVSHARLLHSLDSLRLAETLQDRLEKEGRRLPVLLEVNISGEPEKHGFTPEEAAPAWEQISQLQSLDVRGLMTMAARHGGKQQARENFAALRKLRDTLRARFGAPDALPELSMGMTDDFEEAILEGATLVRIGSALVEGIAHD